MLIFRRGGGFINVAVLQGSPPVSPLRLSYIRRVQNVTSGKAATGRTTSANGTNMVDHLRYCQLGPGRAGMRLRDPEASPDCAFRGQRCVFARTLGSRYFAFSCYVALDNPADGSWTSISLAGVRGFWALTRKGRRGGGKTHACRWAQVPIRPARRRSESEHHGAPCRAQGATLDSHSRGTTGPRPSDATRRGPRHNHYVPRARPYVQEMAAQRQAQSRDGMPRQRDSAGAAARTA